MQSRMLALFLMSGLLGPTIVLPGVHSMSPCETTLALCGGKQLVSLLSGLPTQLQE